MLKTKVRLLSIACIISLSIISCKDTYTPKPRGFQRFEFPPKQYKPYTNSCGFSFEIPDYAVVLPDFSSEHQKCWVNVFYQPYNATLHISYDKAKSRTELFKLMEDARTLVYKHTIKADEIYETQIQNKYLQGMIYDLSGNTATNFQFYVSDTVSNYIRGALYFNVQTNIDSVKPVLNFLEKDVMHMIETIRWNN
ncbi:MAG: gliding motility lipoprotein GldD [Bacteroidia bacterium]|nr:gliding motility lipoprotein GldD [Bacteroidia bacterium]MCC7533720.1 gliding motility lipoprotein GldD [Bacteroidia bacterium]